MKDTVTVYFDGVCKLCSGFVRFVGARDPWGRIEFKTLQGSGIEGFDSVVVEDADGNRYEKSRAVAEVLGRMRLPYRVLGAVLGSVPATLGDFLYDLVASRRKSLFGTREKCVKPRELRE